MDIPRQNAARNRLIRRLAIGAVAAGAIAAVSFYLSRLKPAAPAVEKGAVWMDTVQRGDMLREVRGLGSLVPEEILYVPAPYNGRVERIHLLPGVNVTEDTLLVELRNPDMEQQEIDLLRIHFIELFVQYPVEIPWFPYLPWRHFRGELHLLPVSVLQYLPERPLALPLMVNIGRIDIVHAAVDGMADHPFSLGQVDFPARIDSVRRGKAHGPKTQSRNLKVQFAEFSVLHFYHSSRNFSRRVRQALSKKTYPIIVHQCISSIVLF
jgi:hypothetical protein